MQLVICGSPGSVTDPHVPSKSEDEEPEDDAGPGPDPEPDEDDEPISVPPDAALLALGAVGDSSSVLFSNWQPAARSAISGRTAIEPLVIGVLTLLYARAQFWRARWSGSCETVSKSSEMRQPVQDARQRSLTIGRAAHALSRAPYCTMVFMLVSFGGWAPTEKSPWSCRSIF